ncbi:unnamed protein product [Urochloa humidicola]
MRLLWIIESHVHGRKGAGDPPSFPPRATEDVAVRPRGGEHANKGQGGLRMWWQRAKNRVENANVAESSRAVLVYSTVTLGTATCYVVKSMWDIVHRR